MRLLAPMWAILLAKRHCYAEPYEDTFILVHTGVCVWCRCTNSYPPTEAELQKIYYPEEVPAKELAVFGYKTAA